MNLTSNMNRNMLPDGENLIVALRISDSEDANMPVSARPPKSMACCTIDLDANGLHSGHICFPHSPHDDAWGAQLVPIVSIRNGDGPVILIEAGNHGDEYEGQIAITNLIQSLDPKDIHGQMILLPMVNAPAARAGVRCSPVDGLNFNRSFPGHPHGSLSQQIACYLCSELMARAGYFLDLHSGGSSLSILPSAIVETAADPQMTRANFEAALAFGAQTIVFVNNLDEPRTATATASRQGLVTVGTELSGGGFVDNAALAMCETGLRNVLAYAGILDHCAVAERRAPLILSVNDARCYHLAQSDGVLQLIVSLGQRVCCGEPIGRIYNPSEPLSPPRALRAAIDGTLFALRQQARVSPGNCCAVIATEPGPDNVSDASREVSRKNRQAER